MAPIDCKTAPALLQDVLSFDPRTQAALPPINRCEHAYSCIYDRSRLPTQDQIPDKETQWSVVALCQRCRCHVELNIDFAKATRPCPNTTYPLHHLKQTKIVDSKIWPPILIFECTNRPCSARLEASVRRPVFDSGDIAGVTSTAALKEKYQLALQRNDSVTPQSPYSALDTLLKWVEGCLSQNSRSILARNKRLQTVLGDDAKSVLEKLGFQYHAETDAWDPPDVAAEGRWETLLLDARDELQFVLAGVPGPDTPGSMPPKFPSSPSTRELERVLGMLGYDKCPLSQRRPQNAAPFAHLGAVSDFSDKLVLFCYERQKANAPSEGPRYFDHLRAIVEQRQSELLQTEYSIYQSGGEMSQNELEESFRVIGVARDEIHTLGDQTIADRFRARLLDVGPETRTRMRQALGVIAHFRSSTLLAQIATANKVATYHDALAALGLTEAHDDSWVQSAYITKVSEEPELKADLQKAVNLIAQERKQPELRAFLDFEDGPADESAGALHEACALLDITALDALDEDALSLTYQIRLQEADTEQRKALKTALTVIARHKNSNRLHSLLQDLSVMQTESAPQLVQPSEPRGIRNIGNTCYLNSLLQYLFSLKPVRDLVLNFEEYRDDPESVSVAHKKVVDLPVGKRQVERAHKFVNELRILFDALIHTSDACVTPEVELAILTMENAVKEERRRRSTITRPDTNLALMDVPNPDQGVAGLEPGENPAHNPDLELQNTQALPPLEDGPPIDTNHELPGMNGEAKPDSGDMSAMKSTPDLPEPPPVPPRPRTSHETKLKETIDRYIHNEQQDVNEVAENVLHQLRWAIKAHDIGDDGEQVDEISKLFYGRESLTTITRNGEKVERNVQNLPFLALITRLIAVDAPSAGLYQLLDDHFDRDWIIDSQDRYQFGAITNAPPILHVMISVVDEHQQKVNKKVMLEQEIFMDRYMADDNALGMKHKSWDLKDRLSASRKERALLQQSCADPKVKVSQAMTATADWLSLIQHEAVDLSLGSSEAGTELNSDLAELNQQATQHLETAEKSITKLEQSLEAMFKPEGALKYHLHAVFVHRGTGISGHWWIFIHDPTAKVWRKYNDETVEVVAQDKLQSIFEYDPASPELGSPSLVIYVREDSVTEIVPAVFRDPTATKKDGNQMDEDRMDEGA